VGHLLGIGLVDEGLKGELYARLLCILARDFHLMEIKRVNATFPYAEPFSVKDFLRCLFNDKPAHGVVRKPHRSMRFSMQAI
jgi:hypothetical protein